MLTSSLTLARPAFIALAAAFALAAPANAMAAESTIVVPYDDLDLSTDAGQAELQVRVDRAARQLCGMDARTTGSRVAGTSARSCYESARSQISEQIAEATTSTQRGG